MDGLERLRRRREQYRVRLSRGAAGRVGGRAGAGGRESV